MTILLMGSKHKCLIEISFNFEYYVTSTSPIENNQKTIEKQLKTIKKQQNKSETSQLSITQTIELKNFREWGQNQANFIYFYRFKEDKCCIQLRQVMGKVKPTRKFPCIVKINIFLMEGEEALYSKEVEFQAEEELIVYENLYEQYQLFLDEHDIRYQTDMYTIDFKNNMWHKHMKVSQGFQISISQIQQSVGTLFIFIKNRFYEYKVELQSKIQELRNQFKLIKQALDELKPLKENIQFYRKNSIGVPSILAHTQSFLDKDAAIGQIDLGVLFSQPLYNQQNKPTASAVDFRSEIARLKIALQDSYTPNISMRCQIGRPEALRNIIRLSKPKILHIICHGSRDGFLQFQDNSVHNLGLLNYLKPSDIKKLLKDSTEYLPELVFVNSCHSEKIGRAFFDIGVNIVIMINSEDLISDEASQIFSQNFYRNIFKGQTVDKAFQTAKQTVQINHYSYGCCCNHSAQEGHKQNCRWTSVVTRRHPNPHKDYHVPSNKCKCPIQLRNFNRHKDDCEWARKVLFEINNDFRIKIQDKNQYRFPKRSQYPDYCDKQNKQFIICCCPQKDRRPHNQSYKFKYEIKEGYGKTKLYDVISQIKPDVVDFTPAQLLEAHEKSKNIYGRQIELYQFLKSFRENSMMLVYGRSGVGLTAFTIKAAAYAMQRKICQFFFFIDLYEIKDEIVFRFKFNQITGFKYNGTINQNGVKNKRILIILDNCDDFLRISPEQFYQQIHNIKKQLPKSKFIFNIKEESLADFDINRILCCKFELPPLQFRFAVGYITNKLKDKTDITVGCQQFKKLVTTYDVLKIPKVVESLSQSLSDIKKVTYQNIAENVEQISLFDENILLRNVLDRLLEKSKEAYQFLIFVSQFSQGISFKDLDMFSSYDNKLRSFKLPIKSNWRKIYDMLLQNQECKQQGSQNQLTPSVPKFQQTVSHSHNRNIEVEGSVLQIPDYQDDQFTFEEFQPVLNKRKSGFSDKETNDGQMKGESFFVQKAGHDKFVVKRFIRDFVWNKYLNDTTNKMKFLYVIYFSVILQMLFQSLSSENLVHEELLTYSAISQSGIFSYPTSIDSLYPKRSMTQSTRIAHHIMSNLEQIFMKNQTLLTKLRKTDPTSFITNHKQDFLKIYDFNWTNFILQSRKIAQQQKKVSEVRAQSKIFLCFLENLMIYIPTALKIASKRSDQDSNLIRYVISRSRNQLDNLKSISEPQRSLKLHLKIYTIETGFILDTLLTRKVQQNRMQLEKIKEKSGNTILKFHDKLKGTAEYQQIKKIHNQQNNNSSMYLSWKYPEEKDQELFERIRRQLDSWKENREVQQILMSKQALLIGLNYLHFLTHLKSQLIMMMQKKDMNFLTQILQMCQDASHSFLVNRCYKLKLRCDLVGIQIYWQYHDRFQHKNQLSTPDIYRQIDQWRMKLTQCQKFHLEQKNKLGGFTQFDDTIKILKKQIKQKLWKSAENSIIFMRAYPLYTSGFSIINNLVRKKNNFRKEMQAILCQQVSEKNVQITLKHKDSLSQCKSKQYITLDISTKFQILTKKKIDEETQTVCSIMILSCNFKVVNQKIYMIAEGQFLNEDLIEINSEFSKKFRSDKIYILILTGENAKMAMNKILSFCKSPPVMIALDQTPEQMLDDIHMNAEINSDWIRQSLIQYNEIREAELIYIKYFIKKITRQKIDKKQKIKAIHQAAAQKLANTKNKKVQTFIDIKKCPDFYITYKKGCYRDLSPGYQRNHNISPKFYDDHIILRRWKKMIEVLKHLKGQYGEVTTSNIFDDIDYVDQEQQLIVNQSPQSPNIFSGFKQSNNRLNSKQQQNDSNNKFTFKQQKSPSYINIYGQNNSGKSFFIRQIAKLLVQRQMYDFGVFLFEGKKIQNKYAGNFQDYINNQRKISQMPVIQDFQRIMGENMILIIDDFHLIKPRVNARMKLFMDKIIEKKVNLILVSSTQLKLQWLKNLKMIKLDRMDEFETQVLAFNILDINNYKEIQQYHRLKKQLQRPLTPKQIGNITNKDKKTMKSFRMPDSPFQLKKTFSYDN